MTDRSSSTITVRKTLPKITDGNNSTGTFEIDDTALNEIAHNFSYLAFDGKKDDAFLQVGGTVALINVEDSTGNSLDNFESKTLLDLKNEKYLFTYQISDYRNASVNAHFSVIPIATPPTLKVTDFNSKQEWHVDSNNTLEYGLMSPDFFAWLETVSASDYLGKPLNPTKSPVWYRDASGIEQSVPVDIFKLANHPGEHLIRYRVEDERFAKVAHQDEWNKPRQGASLTDEKEFTIKVVITKPKIDIFYHEPRNGISADTQTIRYLVDIGESNSPFIEKYKEVYSDEYLKYGDFSNGFIISKKVSNPLPGKLYFSGTAFNGTDLTDYVSVVDTVNTKILSVADITLTLEDSEVRDQLDVSDPRVVQTIKPSVEVVDVLAPILELDNHPEYSSGISINQPMEIEGIMKKISLINGIEEKVQVVLPSNDADYYFPDPGLKIYDNYYSQDEILDFHNIQQTDYQFDYVYDSETLSFNDVWEFINNPSTLVKSGTVDMDIAGNYEITYSLPDPQNNIPAQVKRHIRVKDSRKPVVKLYGQKTMFVDLQSILDGDTRYQDPGAYAIENLYTNNRGFFDWTTKDEKLTWRVTFQLYDWDSEEFGLELFDESGNDLIETTILGYIKDPSTLPNQAVKYQVNYYLEDRMGNIGSESRIVELRGSPNLFPHIYFVLSHPDFANGIPNSSNINGNKAELSSLVWQVEVGKNQFIQEPDALVFEDLGGGQRNNIGYTTNLLFLDDANNSDLSPPSYSYQLSSYLTKVNFWTHQGISRYVELLDSEESNGYKDFPIGDANWRRVVIRYTSNDNEFGNYSVRDLEVRLTDTTPPNITKNTFSGGIIEVGDPFNDPGVEIADIAGSAVNLQTTIQDEILKHPGNGDDKAVFAELADRGFWKTGEFTIKYNAEDEFGNQAVEQILNLSVRDSRDPYVGIISNEGLRSINQSNGFSSMPAGFSFSGGPFLEKSNRDPLPYFQELSDTTILNTLTTSIQGYDHASHSFTRGLLEEADQFYIKESSGSDALTFRASQYRSHKSGRSVSYNDPFGRSYIWYSPIEITLGNSKGEEFVIEDPGILIYDEGSEQAVTASTQFVINEKIDASGTQVVSISLSATIEGKNFRNTTVSDFRTYTFLDDEKPLLEISPATNSVDTFILAEAGVQYSDSGSYYLWKNGQKEGLFSASDRSVVASDLITDQEKLEIKSSYHEYSEGQIVDEDNKNIAIDDRKLGSIWRVKYDVSDDADPPNDAEPVYRWVIVKDTEPPTITWNAKSLYEVASSNPDVNDTVLIKKHLLNALEFSATDKYEVDGNLSTEEDFDKWNIQFTPDFKPGEIYPLERTESGYTVTVSVKDNSENESITKSFELKVGDYDAPKITEIGKLEIHDFLRYGKNDSLTNTEYLYQDLNESGTFDSSGFIGGAHRLILSNYDFVDPGVWAEDESFPDDFPDIDGNGKRESYAIKRTENIGDIENPPEVGVIYSFSQKFKNDKDLSYYKDLFENGFEPSEPGPTEPNATKIPDVTGLGGDETIDVHEINIQYRVKDGWGNLSPIKTRKVYIYHSKQYPDSAFYATPIFTKDGDPFEDLYDTNRTTLGIDNPFLTSLQKDYDGDGVSDYWENIFGTRPDDANDNPTSRGIDLANPANYRTDSLSQIPNIP